MRESQIIKPIMDLLNILAAQGKLYYVRCINPGIITREDKPRKGQPDLVGWVFLQAAYSFSISPNLERVGAIWHHVPALFRPFAWEIKGPRGKVSLEQEAELQHVAKMGGQAKVIRSFEEAIEALRELGIEVERKGS